MVKIIIFLILISGLSYLAASIAREKNRDFWKVFWLSMLTSPVVGIAIAYFLEEYKYCQYCFERIKLQATVCRYCRKDHSEENFIDVEVEEVKQDAEIQD